MTTAEPLKSEKENTEGHRDQHTLVDGFVNVNDIIKERRSLRNANPDHAEPNAASSPDH